MLVPARRLSRDTARLQSPVACAIAALGRPSPHARRISSCSQPTVGRPNVRLLESVLLVIKDGMVVKEAN